MIIFLPTSITKIHENLFLVDKFNRTLKLLVHGKLKVFTAKRTKTNLNRRGRENEIKSKAMHFMTV